MMMMNAMECKSSLDTSCLPLPAEKQRITRTPEFEPKSVVHSVQNAKMPKSALCATVDTPSKRGHFPIKSMQNCVPLFNAATVG
jgi:hypothetical protein